jgi:HNH endonuclease
MARLPFSLGQCLQAEGMLYLAVFRCGNSELCLTEGMVQALAQVCKCRHCQGAIASLDDHVGCSSDRPHWMGDVELCLPLERQDVTNKIYGQLQRRASREHRARLVASAGLHAKHEVDRLFDLQEGRCYYCFCQIDLGDRKSFHKDHFEPIANGGSNTISNLVLTCPACNMEKSATSGKRYAKARRSAAPSDLLPELIAMQTRVRGARW